MEVNGNNDVMEMYKKLKELGYRKIKDIGQGKIKVMKDNPDDFLIIDWYKKDKIKFVTSAEIIRDALKLKVQNIEKRNNRAYAKSNKNRGMNISNEDIKSAQKYIEILKKLKACAISKDIEIGYPEDGPICDAIKDVVQEAECAYDVILCSGYMLESDCDDVRKSRFKTSQRNFAKAKKSKAKTMTDIDVR